MPSKLFEVIESLDKIQLKKLSVFYDMPGNGLLLNDRKAGKQLLKLVHQPYSDEKEVWEKALERKWEIGDKRMAGRLFKVTEKFLSLQVLQEDEVLEQMLLTNFYLHQGLHKHARQSLKKFEKLNGDNKNVEFNHFLYEFKMAELKTNMNIKTRNRAKFISRVIPQLTAHYELEQVRLLLTDIKLGSVLKAEEENTKEEVLIKQLETVVHQSEVREVKVYGELFKLMSGKLNKEQFKQLKQVVSDPKLKFSSNERKEIIYHLINFCAYQTNIGDFTYAGDYLELYEQLDKMDKLVDGKYINLPLYKNAVSVAIIAGDHDWAKNFIAQKSRYLEESSTFRRAPFRRFQEAHIALYELELDRCIELLELFKKSPMYKKDAFYRLGADKALIKAYFLRKDIDEAERQFENFKKNLNNNKKLTDKAKLNYKKFYPLMNMLLRNPYQRVSDEGVPSLDKLWLRKVAKVYHWKNKYSLSPQEEKDY